MTIRKLLSDLILAAALLAAAGVSAAPADDERAQTIVHLLDYVSVDYPEFVKDGQVLDASEYEEQKEFAAQAVKLLAQLPAHPEKAALTGRAQALLAEVSARAEGVKVSALATAVRGDVIRVYRLAVAPRAAPDLAAAARLFTAHCAACHGVTGRGDGPLARGMEPAPSNFHDEARMGQRSIYGLFNTIALGVKGTPMRAWTELPEADRWALAFFVSGMRATPGLLARGEAQWKAGQGKAELGSYRALVTKAPTELATTSPALDPVRAFLTAHPEAIQAAAPAPLAFTRARLDEALAAYRAGDADVARRLAITAYLEGFELVEAGLDNVDGPLRTETEKEMMALRAAIGDGKPAGDVAARVERIHALLDRVDQKLAPGGLSPAAAFISAMLILLREGLEAILVLAAILAFVKKTGRRDALPYVHAGWMAAVALGGLTWFVASRVIAISGASRELTEGMSAIAAAAMLLYVGYWLHGKSYAQAWNAYIGGQVSAALGRRTLWAMAGISFLAVYRELFEIILFYETLWVQVGGTGHEAVLLGIAAAAVVLALLGGAILKYSVRLPIGPFFAWTSGLLALMAVVFAGNGVAALQEAGVVDATAVAFVSLPLLGIHPTAQGLAAQAAMLALVACGVWSSRRQAEAASPR